MTEHKTVQGGTIRIMFVLKPQYFNNHIPYILFYANYLQNPPEELEGRGVAHWTSSYLNSPALPSPNIPSSPHSPLTSSHLPLDHLNKILAIVHRQMDAGWLLIIEISWTPYQMYNYIIAQEGGWFAKILCLIITRGLGNTKKAVN